MGFGLRFHPVGNGADDSNRRAAMCGMQAPGHTRETVCRPASMSTSVRTSQTAVLDCQLPVVPANPRTRSTPSSLRSTGREPAAAYRPEIVYRAVTGKSRSYSVVFGVGPPLKITGSVSA